MQKVTFIKQTQCWRGSGAVSISVYKQTVLPDGSVINKVHRISLEPGDDVDSVLAMNSEHLIAMGYPAMDPAEVDLPLQLCTIIANAPKEAGNPIHSIEVNSGGGVRLTVKPQTDMGNGVVDEAEDPVFVEIMPHDMKTGEPINIDDVLTDFNGRLTAAGHLPIEPERMTLVKNMRQQAHQHPIVAERMRVERAEIAEKVRLAAEREAQAQAIREQRRIEQEAAARAEAEAKAEQDRLAAEAAAADAARRQKELADFIDAKVAEQVAAIMEKKRADQAGNA